MGQKAYLEWLEAGLRRVALNKAIGLVDQRQAALQAWLRQQLGDRIDMRPVSADASFRRYFRVARRERTWIAMDAPPHLEPLAPFRDVARQLLQAGVHVPVLYQIDFNLGFVLLEDFGDSLYQEVLNSDTADKLYADALDTLLRIQRANCSGLPKYDRRLLRDEIDLFDTWFLKKYLHIYLPDSDFNKFKHIKELLIDNALSQPRVFVHRDYHSRNLMYLAQDNPGVIDFQDAVCGPLTYDLVSLLRDAYVVWPESKVQQWALRYLDHAIIQGLCPPVKEEEFLRWFDWMGLQRHLKVLGIFCRLSLRDGKSTYLNNLPRVLAYTLQVTEAYPELEFLAEILDYLDLDQVDRRLDT